MKRVTKVATFALTILLFTQLVLPVQAKSDSKKPDPAFKDKATRVDRSRAPYYGKDAVVDTYLADGILYSVDTLSQDVVEIVPEVMDYQIDAAYTEDQLRGMAETMVAEFLGDKIKLDKLSYSLGKKVGTYFFRWEDTKKQLDDGDFPFIQVGFSQNGDFLNFYNTLPFGRDKMAFSGAKVHPNITLIGPFNEIYANRTANTTTTYWSASGAMTSTTGGYFKLYPSPICNASYCSTFLYSSSNASGGWYPNSNTNTKAAVFIPSTHAVANATYVIKRGDLTTFNSTVNQNAYYNAWVLITSSGVSNGIKAINMSSQSSSEVAWDETWVYNP